MKPEQFRFQLNPTLDRTPPFIYNPRHDTCLTSLKKYGEMRAVNDISFEVPQGHIVGYLGPNGGVVLHQHPLRRILHDSCHYSLARMGHFLRSADAHRIALLHTTFPSTAYRAPTSRRIYSRTRTALGMDSALMRAC